MNKSRIVSLICLTIFTVLTSGCTGTDRNIETDNLSTSSGFVRDFEVKTSDNPIDKAFSKDFETNSSTPELNYLANAYLDAWKSEWDNVLLELMNEYQFQEDKNTIKEYKRSYEEFIEEASELEWIDWSDTSVEPGKDRTFGTGAISASLMEEAVLFKNQVLYLIDKYFSEISDYGEYTYLYKGNGAEFDNAK